MYLLLLMKEGEYRKYSERFAVLIVENYVLFFHFVAILEHTYFQVQMTFM